VDTSIARHMPTKIKRPLRMYPHGRCPDCGDPAVDHLDTSGMFELGCPPRRTVIDRPTDHDAALSNRLDELLRGSILAYGAMGTESLIDYLDLCGTDYLRKRLVELLAGGGR